VESPAVTTLERRTQECPYMQVYCPHKWNVPDLMTENTYMDPKFSHALSHYRKPFKLGISVLEAIQSDPYRDLLLAHQQFNILRSL